MRTLFRAALVLSTLLFPAMSGCGGDATVEPTGNEKITPNASSCDYRPIGPSGTNVCQEYVGDATFLASRKNSCGLNPGAVWADAGCPRANVIGGCRTLTGTNTVTNWWYAGGPFADAAAVRARCAMSTDAVFVAP